MAMETIKRLASVRHRPSTAVASRSPIPATASKFDSPKESPKEEADYPPLSPPPRIQIDRSDTASLLVDPTDPAAALAKLASEAVVGLVKRAKSTRGPRRANSTARPSTARRPQSLDLPTHANLLDDERPKTSLKTRPSLRQKFSSRTNKPTLVVDHPPVPDANPKTPTDPAFVHRPKHAGVDLTHLASSLQVPRDSHDASAPAISVTPPRVSSDDVLSRSKSAREHAAHTDLNRAPGECRRCHSKRVQRAQSTRQPTEKEVEAGFSVNNPFSDPAKPPSPPRLNIPDTKENLFATSPDSATPSPGTNGHTKGAPSWASFNGGDDDEVKVVEYRKSRVEPEVEAPRPPTQPQALKPMPVTTEPVPSVRRENTMPAELPPRTLRRQRSVAQRIVDYIRPTGRRGVGTKGVKKFF